MGSPTWPEADLEGLLSGLLYRSHLLAPSDFAATVADQGRLLGAEEVVLYLLDYAQTHLVPLPALDADDRTELSVEGTLAGRALRTYELLESEGPTPGRRRLWVPMLQGTDRLGVLELVFRLGPAARSTQGTDGEGPVDEAADGEKCAGPGAAGDSSPAPPPEAPLALREACDSYATLVAELLATKRLYGDVVQFARQRKPLTLAAEIQWRMLPPLTFATDSLVITASLEPWQEVGGDSFDYALNGDVAHVGIFDAMGHGLDAALLASVATAEYRRARRALLGLAETFTAIDAAIAQHVGGQRFVTALLAEVHIPSGRLRWLSAGHPAPLLLRAGKLIKRLDLPASPPLGLSFAGATISLGEEALEPGDRLLLFTDGVIEARTATGEFFGLDRLGELVVRECASRAPAPEALRRLGRAILNHQQGLLQDDATTLLLEWTGGGERMLMI